MAKVKSLQKRGGLPFLDSAPRWFVIQKKNQYTSHLDVVQENSKGNGGDLYNISNV